MPVTHPIFGFTVEGRSEMSVRFPPSLIMPTPGISGSYNPNDANVCSRPKKKKNRIWGELKDRLSDEMMIRQSGCCHTLRLGVVG